jgi:hypothetical protein
MISHESRSTLVSMLMFGLLLIVRLALAEPPKSVQREINLLLNYIETSGCEFYRNGTWSDSKTAQTHLLRKFKYLAAKDQINTTEDFIEKVATGSALSGQPYEVKCKGTTTVPSKQWLQDELTLIRSF